MTGTPKRRLNGRDLTMQAHTAISRAMTHTGEPEGRRAFRAAAAQVSDFELAAALAYFDEVIRAHPETAADNERVVSLRALRHEAVVVRNWDARDDVRVKWADIDIKHYS